MVDSNAPIGVFDSGLGGLTVVSQMMRFLPQERILFVADQAHVPYGGRDLSEVCGFACGISEGLLRAECKAVVMACNISSATALHTVQAENPDTLVLGVIEPGAHAAARTTANGRIGVLTTVGTARSAAYTRTLHSLRPDLFVQEVPCPDFVPLVEADAIVTPAAFRAAQEYLEPLMDAEVDTVVLGCTHYPFLLPVLQKVAPDIRFVNPAEETVLELAREIGNRRLVSSASYPVPHCLTTTGDPTQFAAQLHRFLPPSAQPFRLAAAHWKGGELVIDDTELSLLAVERRLAEPR
jgi:glutamate racemase